MDAAACAREDGVAHGFLHASMGAAWAWKQHFEGLVDVRRGALQDHGKRVAAMALSWRGCGGRRVRPAMNSHSLTPRWRRSAPGPLGRGMLV